MAMLIDSQPADGATDVAVGASLQFTFDTSLDRATITQSTVVLYRADTAEVVPSDVSLSTNGAVILVIPNRGLLEDTGYIAMLAGSDSNLAGGNIKEADGLDLVITQEINFKTRVERFVPLSEVASRDDIESVGPIRAEDLTSPSGLVTIIESSPAGFTSNVSRDLTEVVVTFSMPVSAVGSVPALEVTCHNVLGLDEYYGEQGADTDASSKRPSDRFLQDWLASDSDDMDLFTPPCPSGYVTVYDSKAKWTRHPGSPPFHYNTEVVVHVVASSLMGPSGEVMADDVYFTFTTEYFPMYVGVDYIRLKLGRVLSDMYDDTIRRHILAASIDAVDQAAGHFDVEHPYPAVRRYVRACALLSILDELGLLPALQSGQKTLGDFSVRYDPRDFKKIMAAYTNAVAERDAALLELRAYRRQGLPRVIVRGQDYPYERLDFRLRTWQHLVGGVNANTTELRSTKAQLATDHPKMGQPINWIGNTTAGDKGQGIAFPWWNY